MDRARTFLAGVKSNGNLLGMGRRDYPVSAEEYELLEEAGRGVSATVWKARCKATGEDVAVKLLDLENLNCSLEEIVREAQTMRQQHHPNVLPLHCSFVHQQNLWMVMPYVAGGSVLNLMKFAYSEGLEEPVIATILKEVLKGLDYMHRHGGIHRDVKAGNILIDKDGTVLLADFGVAATMERGGTWGNQQMSRNTFVGTPCWMAPEVMEQTEGYNSLADIWSFGITILELAHGHAPFAKLPPMKVLLMTIQNPPPTLESDSGKKHFSKSMRDIVGKCLIKDASKRPSAAQLLEHKFFKTAHEPSYLVKHLLGSLPPVVERVKLMRKGQAPNGSSEDNLVKMAQSQEAYIRGVSGWNFDVAALKRSANGEGSGLERLSTIAETPGTGMSTGQSSNPSPFNDFAAQNGGPNQQGSQLQSNPSIVSQPSGYQQQQPSAQPPFLVQYGNNNQEAGPLSPQAQAARPPLARDSSQGVALPRVGSAERLQAAATPGKQPQAKAQPVQLKPGHKKQGRFEVYEGDAQPPMSPPVGPGQGYMDQNLGSKPTTPEHSTSRFSQHSTFEVDRSHPPQLGRSSFSEGPDSARVSESGTAKAADGAEKSKRKGRFQIVEEDPTDPGKRGVGRSTSVASMDSHRSAQGPQTALLGPLKEVLESMTGGYEVMKEVVAALQDTERGKTASMTVLLQELQERQAGKPSREEQERLRQEGSHLREENARLRDRVHLLEEELRRASNERGPAG
ncbi:hypothetical protein ABBQ38_002941 [Trebouxia sp. C0009 RCD-2024]